MGTLVFGASTGLKSPSNAIYSGIRLGSRNIGTLKYETLRIAGNSTTVSTDEVGTLLSRTDEPRMTTGAFLFEDGDKMYRRSGSLHEVTTLDTDSAVREKGDIVNEAYGITVSIFRSNAASGDYAYFDNGFFELSNALWEFSPDGGTTWYPYHDMPNRAGTCVMLPNPTTSIMVRVMSNAPTEWVKSFTVTPLHPAHDSEVAVGTTPVTVTHSYAALTWDKVDGAEVYAVYNADDEMVGFTYGTYYDCGTEDNDGWYVIAMNAISKTLKTA